MNRKVKLIVIIFILLFVVFSLVLYYIIRAEYDWGTFEHTISRMMIIYSVNLFFFVLMFLIEIKQYQQTTKVVLIVSISIWIFIFTLQFIDLGQLPWQFWYFWDVLVIFAYGNLGPALILYIIHYIKESTGKYKDVRVFDKYHLHESFVGVVLFLGILLIILLRNILLQYEIFSKELSFVLYFINVLIFAFLYLGSFFIFRDWDDLIHFKFIEKAKESKEMNEFKDDESVFVQLTKEDLHFLEFPRLILYPIGIFLTIVSINAVVHGFGFFPTYFFFLDYQTILLVGYICCFLAGGLIGKDWFRIFKRFYPELYGQIESVIKKLKSK